MNFDNLKYYFGELGYKTFIDGSAPYRRIIVSKNNYGGEYYENDWVKLSEEEKIEELEEITTLIDKILNIN